MNEQVLTEYVKHLIDQRTQLELTIFQLRKELSDLKQSKQEGSTETQSGVRSGELHQASSPTS